MGEGRDNHSECRPRPTMSIGLVVKIWDFVFKINIIIKSRKCREKNFLAWKQSFLGIFAYENHKAMLQRNA